MTVAKKIPLGLYDSGTSFVALMDQSRSVTDILESVSGPVNEWASSPMLHKYAGLDVAAGGAEIGMATFEENEVNAVVCEVRCSAGEQPGTRGEGCVPCPQHFSSNAGERACRFLLISYTTWLRQAHDNGSPYSSLEITQNNETQELRITAMMHMIPTKFFETGTGEVVHMFDIAPYQGELEERSECSEKWERIEDDDVTNTTTWQVTLKYWDLEAGPCNLEETQDDEFITRKGYVKAYLVARLDPEHTVWSKVFPIEIQYNRILQQRSKMLNIWIPDWDSTLYFEALPHPNTVLLWHDNFLFPKPIRAFDFAERIYLEHCLDDDKFQYVMEVIAGILSSSQNPEDQSATAHNIMEGTAFQTHSAPRPGCARVSFLAIHECELCYFHVASKLTLPDGRRIEANDGTNHNNSQGVIWSRFLEPQSMAITIPAATIVKKIHDDGGFRQYETLGEADVSKSSPKRHS
jgi:hypothetical protein